QAGADCLGTGEGAEQGHPRELGQQAGRLSDDVGDPLLRRGCRRNRRTFTADERAVVGPWLNDLVKRAAASHWKDRADNKVYMRTYIALLWGLMAGDDKPVQDAIFTYKLAIHDMRPDGSWPIDSQRGGMGLLYNSAAASQVVMIALA